MAFFYPIYLSILNAPSIMFEIFPFIFLIAVKFFYLQLVEKNEMDILKTNGISNLKIISLLIIICSLIGILILLFFTQFRLI